MCSTAKHLPKLDSSTAVASEAHRHGASARARAVVETTAQKSSCSTTESSSAGVTRASGTAGSSDGSSHASGWSTVEPQPPSLSHLRYVSKKSSVQPRRTTALRVLYAPLLHRMCRYTDGLCSSMSRTIRADSYSTYLSANEPHAWHCVSRSACTTCTTEGTGAPHSTHTHCVRVLLVATAIMHSFVVVAQRSLLLRSEFGIKVCATPHPWSNSPCSPRSRSLSTRLLTTLLTQLASPATAAESATRSLRDAPHFASQTMPRPIVTAGASAAPVHSVDGQWLHWATRSLRSAASLLKLLAGRDSLSCPLSCGCPRGLGVAG